MRENLETKPLEKKKYRSIRLLLIYALVLAVLIPALVTNVVAALRSLNSVQQQAMNQLQTVADLRELQINSFIDSLQLEVRDTVNSDLASRLDNVLSANSDTALSDLQAYLNQLPTRTSNREALFIVDTQGKVLVSTDTMLLGQQYREWVISGRIRQPFIAPITTDVTNNKPSLLILQPILIGSKQVGGLVGRYNLEPLSPIMQNVTGLGETGETYLVSLQDKLLTGSRFDGYPIGTVISQPQGIQQVLSAGGSGSSQYIGYRSSRMVGYYRWLPALQVGLIAEQELSEIQSPTLTTLIVNGVVTLIAAFIAIMAGLFLITRRISQPLGSLSETAQAIAGGNLKIRSLLHPHNEIGVLAESFNQMTGQLADLIDTLEKRVEDRTRDLEAARLEAEKANRLKSQFLANMSHELRTPLNAILNYSSFVMQGFMGPVNEEQAQSLETVVSSGNHLLNLINDILDIAKIEVGQMDFMFEETNLPDVIKGVASITQGLLKNKAVKFIVDVDEQLPEIKADGRRLHQVFLNLLSNAVKFTLEGTITLSAHREGNQVHMAVCDTGLGVGKDDIDLIFESFRQAEHGLRLGNSGTGLGLPISKHIIEAHGGRLWVESEPGKGSTFHVTLFIDGQGQVNPIIPMLIHQSET